MAVTFSHYEQIWTDEILDLGGGVKDAKLRCLAVFTDGGIITRRWRYFGQTALTHPTLDGNPIDEFPSKRSTTVISDLSTGNAQYLYDLAIQHDIDLLNK